MGYSPYRIKRFPLQLIKIVLLDIFEYGRHYWLRVKVKFRLKNGVLLLRGILQPKLRRIMKEYVLKIGFNPITEEILYVKEYIDKSKATLHIDDKDVELEEEVADYIVGDIIGLA